MGMQFLISLMNNFLIIIILGFSNWDGQYFLHVAVHGYTEEKMLAFFPLFPKTVYYLSQIVNIFVGSFIGFSSLVLAVGWILNTALFVNSANMLYDLVKITNKNLDPTPVILFFCFNPASIFFSSFYSESLLIFLTLKVLLSLHDE
jgi:phosphatidylinositol glycan class V